jgi:hypothetical protein
MPRRPTACSRPLRERSSISPRADGVGLFLPSYCHPVLSAISCIPADRVITPVGTRSGRAIQGRTPVIERGVMQCQAGSSKVSGDSTVGTYGDKSVPCQWFSRLASALDHRSAPRLALLFLGAVLARGRRTVTSWIRAAKLELAVELLRWAKTWLGILAKPLWVVADGCHRCQVNRSARPRARAKLPPRRCVMCVMRVMERRKLL